MLEEYLVARASKMADAARNDPGSHKDLVELFNVFFDVSFELMKTSPEFRQNFARVHASIFTYPEGQQVLDSINQCKDHTSSLH